MDQQSKLFGLAYRRLSIIDARLLLDTRGSTEHALCF